MRIFAHESLTRSFSSALSLLDDFTEQHAVSAVIAILLLYFAQAFFVSRATDMTPDELLTYAEAQLPSLHALGWTLKNIPTALDPPLHPFLSFFAFRLPVSFPLSLRVPAIVAYAALILSLFVFVRRRAPVSIALIAAAAPMVTPMFNMPFRLVPMHWCSPFQVGRSCFGSTQQNEGTDGRARYSGFICRSPVRY